MSTKRRVILRILAGIITFPIWVWAVPFAFAVLVMIFIGAMIKYMCYGVWDTNW
jgi:hypothetical protein